MKNLKAKLNKQGGFTLIEMLIVVAIIAILVAVSIPLVNSSLERARESTDAANERSFKAVLLISFANGKYDVTDGSATPFDVDTIYKYDAANGVIADKGDTSVKTYGKSTKIDVVDGINRKGQVLYGMVDSTTGSVLMMWKTGAAPTPQAIRTSNNGTLIHPLMVEEA